MPTKKVRAFDAFHTEPIPKIRPAGEAKKRTTTVGRSSDATSSSPEPAASK